MNSHNGRTAEEAATLTDTMGRQKLGCSPSAEARPERARGRTKRASERASEAPREGTGTDGVRGSNGGQRTCIICEEEAQVFHAGRFRRGGSSPANEASGNDVGRSIDNKIAGPMISERKGTTTARCRQRRTLCTRALAPVMAMKDEGLHCY